MNLAKQNAVALAAMLVLVLVVGCSDRDPAGLDPAQGNTDPVVFHDDYGANVYFQAFLNTNLVAVSKDSVFAYEGFAADGARSLKINVAPDGTALGVFSGGVLTSAGNRDLTGYNALTFYARASRAIHLDVLGFGNDNTGNSLYSAGVQQVPLSTVWKRVVIPIPDPEKLVAERGLLTFAEGLEQGAPQGYDIWLDEIRFAKLENITNPRPVLPSSNKQYFVGPIANLSGIQTTFDVDGADVVVDHMPGYLDFTSSNPAVTKVTPQGIEVIAVGDATVTASLDGVPATGSVVINGFQAPEGPAPTPAHPAGDVISLYSDVYGDHQVDSWNPHWGYSTAEDGTFEIQGDHQRMYSALNFVGIDFASSKIDATDMNYFHIDVFAPFGTDFSVKLVALGPTNALLGQAELTFDATTTPAFNAGQWSSLDIPMEDFIFPPTVESPWSSIGQLVLKTTDAQLVLVDNMYWHR